MIKGIIRISYPYPFVLDKRMRKLFALLYFIRLKGSKSLLYYKK